MLNKCLRLRVGKREKYGIQLIFLVKLGKETYPGTDGWTVGNGHMIHNEAMEMSNKGRCLVYDSIFMRIKNSNEGKYLN